MSCVKVGSASTRCTSISKMSICSREGGFSLVGDQGGNRGSLHRPNLCKASIKCALNCNQEGTKGCHHLTRRKKLDFSHAGGGFLEKVALGLGIDPSLDFREAQMGPSLPLRGHWACGW